MLFSLKNTVFTVFSGINQNPVVSVWYYHMPYVETQVRYTPTVSRDYTVQWNVLEQQ